MAFPPCGGIQFVSPMLQGSAPQHGAWALLGGLPQFSVLQSQPLLPDLQQLQQQSLMQLMQLQQVQQGQAQSARRAPSALELAAAVESLYLDGLRPYGRILRKRLLELTEMLGFGRLDVDLKELKAACQSCAYLSVEEAESDADWSALLAGRPQTFVDVYSPSDPYSRDMWQHAERYFSSLPVGAALPGGRFACAQVLAQRRLPFFVGMSLGQICHIVQLAISQRKLLGYTNGTLVPYYRSESKKKDQSAINQHPCTGRGSRRSTVVTWDLLRSCLTQYFQTSPLRSPRVPLSNIKRVFRSQFQVELSETALGYAKLSELFQDPRLDGVCTVSQTSLGFVVAPPPGFARTSTAPAAAVDAPRRRGAPVAPLSMDLIEADAGTFKEAAPSPQPPRRRAPSCPPTPSPSAVAGKALPTLLGSLHVPPCGCGGRAAMAEAVDAGKRPSKLAGTPALTMPRLSVLNTFIHFALPPPTPLAVQSRPRARSLPRDG